MRNKNIEKTNAKQEKKKKNNHTHKTIFTWFGNLLTSMKLQGFHYYLINCFRLLISSMLDPAISISSTYNSNMMKELSKDLT